MGPWAGQMFWISSFEGEMDGETVYGVHMISPSKRGMSPILAQTILVFFRFEPQKFRHQKYVKMWIEATTTGQVAEEFSNVTPLGSDKLNKIQDSLTGAIATGFCAKIYGLYLHMLKFVYNNVYIYICIHIYIYIYRYIDIHH